MKYQLKIKADGTMEFLGEPPPGFPVHEVKRDRFSEIVPVPWRLFIAFRVLRFLFGEKGRVSRWTRRWHCEWECTILRGQSRGLVRWDWDREQLIKWEKQVWKKTNKSLNP